MPEIIPAVPEKEMQENGPSATNPEGNIYYLKLDKTEDRAGNAFYEMLSSYISDPDLLSHSILLEVNKETGTVRSAFVSNADRLGYDGAITEKTNVLDREHDTRYDKEIGYYGVDYTGQLPDLLTEQDLQVEIINGDRVLEVKCIIPEKENNTPTLVYTLDITDAIGETVYTSIPIDIKKKRTKEYIVENAADLLAAGEPLIYYLSPAEDPSLEADEEAFVLLLDSYTKHNATRSSVDISINARYPEIPIGMIGAKLSAHPESNPAVSAGEAQSNVEHAYYDGLSVTPNVYNIEDARHLYNIRYFSGGAFQQIADISMQTYAEEDIFIAPIGDFTGVYDGRNKNITDPEPVNYQITDLKLTNWANNADEYIGLFAENSGELKNISLVDAEIVARGTVGGIAGKNTGVISDCIVSGSIAASTDSTLGGVAGGNARITPLSNIAETEARKVGDNWEIFVAACPTAADVGERVYLSIETPPEIENGALPVRIRCGQHSHEVIHANSGAVLTAGMLTVADYMQFEVRENGVLAYLPQENIKKEALYTHDEILGSGGYITKVENQMQITGGGRLGGIAGINMYYIEASHSGIFIEPTSGISFDSYLVATTLENESKIMTNRARGVVGGIAAENSGRIEACWNTSLIQATGSEAVVGGLVGQNKENGVVTQNYNAGRTVATGAGSTVGGLIGENGIDGIASLSHSYNTGRVNLNAEYQKEYETNLSYIGDAALPVLLEDGIIGGIIGRNGNEGKLEDVYHINYVGIVKESGSTVGGVIGVDESLAEADVQNISYIAGEGGIPNAMGETAHPERENVRAIFYDPTDATPMYTQAVNALRSYHTPQVFEAWGADNTPLRNHYYYEHPYFKEAENAHTTPWEKIKVAQQGLVVELINDRLLTAEWRYTESEALNGVKLELLNGSNNAVLDVFENLDLEALRQMTSEANALSGNGDLTAASGRRYGFYYNAHKNGGTYIVVLDGLALDNNMANQVTHHHTNVMYLCAQVTYPSEPSKRSEIENNKFGYDGNTGTTTYTIKNERHLYNIRYDLEKDFIQTADVRMRNYDGASAYMTPLGYFSGTYNGGQKKIENLQVRAALGDTGLFAQNAGTIENIEFVNLLADGTNGTAVGAVAGTNVGNIRNVTLNAGTVQSLVNVGGIAGVNAGRIENCVVKNENVSIKRINAATGTYGKNVGGIVGENAGTLLSTDVLISENRTVSGLFGAATYTVSGDIAALAAQDPNGYVYIRFEAMGTGTGAVRAVDIKDATGVTYRVKSRYLNANQLDWLLPGQGTNLYMRFYIQASGELRYTGQVTIPDTESKIIGDEHTPVVPTVDARYILASDSYASGNAFYYRIENPISLVTGASYYVAFDDLIFENEDDTSFKGNRMWLVAQNGTTYQLFTSATGTNYVTVNYLMGRANAKNGYFVRFTYNGSRFVLAEWTDTLGYISSPYLGTIEGCVNEAGLAMDATQVEHLGGIAGINNGYIIKATSGTLTEEMTEANVVENQTKYTGTNLGQVGGIAGNNQGEIREAVSVAMVDVATPGANVGGIVGYNENIVHTSYNAGSVAARHSNASVYSYVGGIAGTNKGTAYDVYNTGRINIERDSLANIPVAGSVGGIVGRNLPNTVLRSAYNIGYVGAPQQGGTSANTGGIIGLNENMNVTGDLRVQNVFTVTMNLLDRTPIGVGGSVLGAENISTARSVLVDAPTVTALGEGYTKGVPSEQNYSNDFPQLKNLAHKTPWEYSGIGQLRTPGLGSKQNPYRISSTDALAAMAMLDGKDVYFVQTADIDMEGIDYAPIASFSGHYDGQGFAIRNLMVQPLLAQASDGKVYAGYIGTLEADATFENVVFENVYMSRRFENIEGEALYFGAIVGQNKGLMSRVEVRSGLFEYTVGQDVPEEIYVGGVVGYNSGSMEFVGSGTMMLFTGYEASGATKLTVGGVVGYHTGLLEHSFRIGTLVTDGFNTDHLFVGGLVGEGAGVVQRALFVENEVNKPIGASGMVYGDTVKGYTREKWMMLSAEEVLSLLNGVATKDVWTLDSTQSYRAPWIAYQA
ncbi:MAG: hypothetical protein ACOX3W_07790 [Christensenellaceae bacterium]